MLKTILKNNKGYTLLFAVLVSSVVLSIGISILSISKKEFLLASSARESTTAFYAADSGIECAIFNDNNISTTSYSTHNNIYCLGQTMDTYLGSDPGNSPAVYNFNMSLAESSAYNAPCLKLKITKDYFDSNDGLGPIPRTRIESRGYNMGWDNVGKTCSVGSPRRVERGISYTF